MEESTIITSARRGVAWRRGLMSPMKARVCGMKVHVCGMKVRVCGMKVRVCGMKVYVVWISEGRSYLY